MPRMKRLLAIVLLLSAASAAPAQDGEVRIYRCTDATGKQSLRDTPCPAGQNQQARDMLRPKDPPPKPIQAPTAPPPVPAPTAPTQTTVYLAPPRPMYECTTHEGKRYTSENGEGNPRWVPYWTLGYPHYGGFPHARASREGFRPATPVNASAGRPPPARPVPAVPTPRHGRMPWPVAGGGSWIRDDCAMLPPRETCARLRDRRGEIRTRFFNAMPSERDELRLEERAINARLDDDCGGR